MRRLASSIAAAFALAGASPAGAATVSVYRPPCSLEQSKYGQCNPDQAQFSAKPGEANRVTITRTVDPPLYQPKVAFRDDGAPLTAGEGCTQVDDHSADCTGYQLVAVVDTGDGDDSVQGPGIVDAGPGNDLVIGDGVLTGGPGDDQLQGGDQNDTIMGGPGRDILAGGGGNDTLQPDDGERGELDVVDGGPGVDVVSYQARRDPLTVSLLQPMAGEDRLSAVESIRGGAGPDRLTGDAGPNALDGGPGDDVLSGGDGGDRIDGGAGADTIDGGAGADTIYSGDDRSARNTVACGTGRDDVAQASVKTLVGRDCERLGETAFDLVAKAVVLSLHARSAGAPLLALEGLLCIERPCAVRMQVSVASGARRGTSLGGRRIAYPRGRRPPRRIALRLSAAGARFVRHNGPLEARVTIAARDGSDTGRNSFLIPLGRERGSRRAGS